MKQQKQILTQFLQFKWEQRKYKFLKIHFRMRYVRFNIVLPLTVWKNFSSMFPTYMGTGSCWITCLKFEFLNVPLIFRACGWKAIERSMPLLLVLKALSALMLVFWHPLSCVLFCAETDFLKSQVFHKALVAK